MTYWIAVFVVYTGSWNGQGPLPSVVPGTTKPITPAHLYATNKLCARNLAKDVAASDFGKGEVLPAYGGFACAEIRILDPK